MDKDSEKLAELVRQKRAEMRRSVAPAPVSVAEKVANITDKIEWAHCEGCGGEFNKKMLDLYDGDCDACKRKIDRSGSLKKEIRRKDQFGGD